MNKTIEIIKDIRTLCSHTCPLNNFPAKITSITTYAGHCKQKGTE